MKVYLPEMGLVNAAGGSKQQVLAAIISGNRFFTCCDWVPNKPTVIGQVHTLLQPIPSELSHLASRNLALALTAIDQFIEAIAEAKQRYGAARVGVVVGTSTSGILAGEEAIAATKMTGERPVDYCYQQQEIGNLSGILARYLGLLGPAYTLSTACSSSAHALASGQRMIAAGLVDAVVVGGADSLCKLTVNGFSALDSISSYPTVPFSANRQGINIGEAAAFFLMTRDKPSAGTSCVTLEGAGASSDAHHISAPDPAGQGAKAAITQALQAAGISASAIDYINLHGTGTALNDAMEAKVVDQLFPHAPLVSSSKGQLGHTLGAAGATEAALCWLMLSSHNSDQHLLPHVFDGQYDSALPALNLVKVGHSSCGIERVLSQSFAFGGNNAALILGKDQD